jgi:DNA polymerase III subunit alpha
MLEGQEVDIALPGHYAVTPRLRQALKMIPGVERVDDA